MDYETFLKSKVRLASKQGVEAEVVDPRTLAPDEARRLAATLADVAEDVESHISRKAAR